MGIQFPQHILYKKIWIFFFVSNILLTIYLGKLTNYDSKVKHSGMYKIPFSELNLFDKNEKSLTFEFFWRESSKWLCQLHNKTLYKNKTSKRQNTSRSRWESLYVCHFLFGQVIIKSCIIKYCTPNFANVINFQFKVLWEF